MNTSALVEKYTSYVNNSLSFENTYAYDLNGNITRIRYNDGTEIRYVYDDIGQLIRVDDKYTVAIETILGGALQNIIVSDERASKDAIAYLKRTDGGRATFMPLDTVKPSQLEKKDIKNQAGFIGLASDLVSHDEKYSAAIRYLLGRIAVCDNINSASALAKKYGYSFRIVTLDGQIINS